MIPVRHEIVGVNMIGLDAQATAPDWAPSEKGRLALGVRHKVMDAHSEHYL